jgi:NADH-quinone oxidoreductase subunit E
MSGRHFAPDNVQPDSFAWSGEYQPAVDVAVAKYPESRKASAVIPLLDLAQRQEGWVTRAAIEAIAGQLDMAPMRVMEVASFYTMFNLAPIGKYHVQVCGTTPCWLRGVDQVYAALKDECGIGNGQTSDDGLFTVTEVECLGACVNSPMVQINDDSYEDLDKDNFAAVLRALKNGETPKANSQIGRQSSEAGGGATSLTDVDFSVRYTRQLNGEAPTEDAAPEKTAPATAPAEAGQPALDDPARPPALDGARDGQADDLKKINGVGPKIEGILNELGIHHYDQVAAWTSEQAGWIDGYLQFKGRIEREEWIEQAKALTGGDA